MAQPQKCRAFRVKARPGHQTVSEELLSATGQGEGHYSRMVRCCPDRCVVQPVGIRAQHNTDGTVQVVIQDDDQVMGPHRTEILHKWLLVFQ